MQCKYLQFQDLGPKFYISTFLLPLDTKEGMKTLFSQSERKKKTQKKHQHQRQPKFYFDENILDKQPLDNAIFFEPLNTELKSVNQKNS